jgi:hypothetical protein
MVDLRFARIMVVAATAAMLPGCMAATGPVAFEKPYPRSSSEVRKAMAAALEANDRPALTRRTTELAWMGGTLSDATLARIAPGLDAQVLAAARTGSQKAGEVPADTFKRWFAANGETYATSEPFAEVPAEYRLVEGVAWDAKTRRLFIGTVIEGRLAYRNPDGNWHEVPVGSPRGGLFGMAVDVPRRQLWIATGSVEQTAVTGERMTGLIAVNLDTLEVVRRVPIAPGGAGAVGDLVIAKDGTVYASNVISGAIHRCLPGCATLEDFIAPGKFRNPQGLALSANGKRLYVADYLSGLWVADPRTAALKPLAIGEPTMLDGIDGLVIQGNTLIAIQNGTRPRRIVKFELDRAGDRITGTRKWIAIAPEAGEPTLGVIRAATGDLLFIGDSQWERYGASGVLRDGQPPHPTPILLTELADIVV